MVDPPLLDILLSIEERKSFTSFLMKILTIMFVYIVARHIGYVPVHNSFNLRSYLLVDLSQVGAISSESLLRMQWESLILVKRRNH